MEESKHTYLIALGSNQRVPDIGLPRAVIAQALQCLDNGACEILASSAIFDSAPIGPSQRRYANAAAILASDLPPPALLSHLQEIEAGFGRNRRGQRWRARPLDLDIVLWSGGIYASRDLAIPHPAMRTRAFVLGPAMMVAGDWRDPVGGLSIRQLFARLTKRPTPPR